MAGLLPFRSVESLDRAFGPGHNWFRIRGVHFMGIEIGQIYRDMSYDKVPLPQECRKRTVRILSQEPDGRWLAVAVTNGDGTPGNGRKTRLKETTLASGYELVADAPEAKRQILKVGELPDDVVEAIRTAEYGKAS